MTWSMESVRLGWAERLLTSRADVDRAWVPGPLFGLLILRRRRRFFFLRWEWWLDWSFLAAVLGVWFFPWLLVALMTLPALAAVMTERHACKVAAGLARSGMILDLVLTGASYRETRNDLEAYLLSRSILNSLLFIYLMVLGLIFGSHVMAPMFIAQDKKFDWLSVSRAIVRHGIDRAWGISNAAGQAVVAFVVSVGSVFVYIVAIFSPLVLFLVVYLTTGSGVAAVIALIVGVHVLILMLALRSGKPRPFGQLGGDMTRLLAEVTNPPKLTDDEVLELLQAR